MGSSGDGAGSKVVPLAFRRASVGRWRCNCSCREAAHVEFGSGFGVGFDFGYGGLVLWWRRERGRMLLDFGIGSVHFWLEMTMEGGGKEGREGRKRGEGRLAV